MKGPDNERRLLLGRPVAPKHRGMAFPEAWLLPSCLGACTRRTGVQYWPEFLVIEFGNVRKNEQRFIGGHQMAPTGYRMTFLPGPQREAHAATVYCDCC